ncbi:DUF6538 domain-containing protein [Devosia submarina]|uniref:DUF6538 domain-containing protein n=1 Tax=Devosia submarina TaxID=1173082 RepID=UPI000D35B0EF|nr:DUF6538 domain-containing protein [Devosia submarina]
MGTKLPFCILRGTTFYWRRRLPSPFKMSVEFSLGTKDLRVARGLSSMLTIETDRAFAVLREGKMTPEQVDYFARQKFAEHRDRLSELHEVERDLKSSWQEEVIATRAAAIAMSILAQHGRSANLSDWPGIGNSEFDPGTIRTVKAFFDNYRQEHFSDERARQLKNELSKKFGIEEPTAVDIAQARSATLEAYAAAGATIAAKFGGAPKSLADLTALAARFSEAPTAQVSSQRSVDPELSSVINEDHISVSDTEPATSFAFETEVLIADPAARVTAESNDDSILEFARNSISAVVADNEIRRATARQKLAVIVLFVDITGKQTFQSLKQTDIKKFVDTMALLPKVRRRSAAEQELSVEELIAKGRTLPKKEVGLAADTVNRNLSYLSVLIRRARMAGIEGIAPLEIGGFRKKKKGKANERRPTYQQEDLLLLFKHPIWTGCHSAVRRHLPGKVIVWDAIYWCPLISVYCGARLEEIAGLKMTEVITDYPIPHLIIQENENRGLKTISSERKVPIHPLLLTLGFLRYVAAKKKECAEHLFPELKPNPGTETSWGARVTRKFSEAVAMMLGEDRVEKDKNKTFHSFRHYICTTLGGFNDLKDKIVQDIVGHENVGTTDRVYKDPTPLDVMLEAIARLPDVTNAAYQASTEWKIVPARRQVKEN